MFKPTNATAPLQRHLTKMKVKEGHDRGSACLPMTTKRKATKSSPSQTYHQILVYWKLDCTTSSLQARCISSPCVSLEIRHPKGTASRFCHRKLLHSCGRQIRPT